MFDEDLRVAFDLGQPVRRRDEPSGRLGYIVAVMLNEPYLALVRWADTEPTFEPLDNLVDAIPEFV